MSMKIVCRDLTSIEMAAWTRVGARARRFLLQSITGTAHRSEATIRCTLACFQHPRQPFASDVGGNLVIAVELTEGDIVAVILQARGDAPAAIVDWKNVI